MAFEQQHSLAYIVAFILGLSVGSFLNVLALRSLEEKSLFTPASSCPHCGHLLGVLDLVPIVSYLVLKGRCRYCKQRIWWHYPVVELLAGIVFVVMLAKFGLSWEGLAMTIFACTLIAICITDFKAKLIPHEITYPSMLLGIFYSAAVRHDALGTLAGIGVSYILFDFLAFYGLKLYIAIHKYPTDRAHGELKVEGMDAMDDELDRNFEFKEGEPEEEIEVMGGGDAVLSAVISAWLGWQKLAIALVFGFLVGTLMGCVYLIAELHRRHMLKQCVAPSLFGALIALGLVELLLCVIALLTHVPFIEMPWLTFGAIAIMTGALVGVISVGSRVSRPFPFGPALAAGAFIAMFCEPIGILYSGGA